VLRRAASRQRADPREQLLEVKRLHHVIVGAGIETGDAVIDSVARRQHQDRRANPGHTQAMADLEPVYSGQVDVEYHDVIRGRCGHPQSVLAVDRHVGEHPLLAQRLSDQRRQLGLVLDD